ncbi:MAG: GntR family transcriptional regulator [Rhizomicrobium sp.]
MPDVLKRPLSVLTFEDHAAEGELGALAPVERETLQGQVYLQLREAIMAGRFRPGQTLTLRSVSEALGVSHMPVRGALQRLEAEGAIGSPANRRTLVVPELRVGELDELRDIRVELEGLAAQRAAARVTPEELLTIGKHARLMQDAANAGDVEAYIRENWAFHTAVYKASRMERLLSLVEILWLRIGPYVRLMMPDRAAMLESMPNHHDVFEALQRHDSKAARKSIAADIADSADHLRTVLRP